jgi:hypothetical protein
MSTAAIMPVRDGGCIAAAIAGEQQWHTTVLAVDVHVSLLVCWHMTRSGWRWAVAMQGAVAVQVLCCLRQEQATLQLCCSL